MKNPKPTGICTDGKRDEKGRWLPGVSGSNGRPKGSRNKLGEDFLRELAADFEQHGAQVIASVRTEDPTAYLKICASLLPRELTVKTDPLEEMSDVELDRYIRQLAAALGLEFGSGDGGEIIGKNSQVRI